MLGLDVSLYPGQALGKHSGTAGRSGIRREHGGDAGPGRVSSSPRPPSSKVPQTTVGRIERKIVLIDGKRLAELMIDHGIGVTTARTYTIKKLDSDYFVEDEG